MGNGEVTRARRTAVQLLAALFFICIVLASPAQAVETTLVPAGATWKYLDDGSNQGAAWSANAFDDAAWAAGPAQLGYGDGDEATVVGFGPNSANKYITTYFRRSFTVADAGAFAALTLRLLRDDGAVVYLNGAEVWRSNMPAGPVGFGTLAPVAVGGADESAWVQTPLNPALLTNGTNVIAVELHQSGGASTDISFDLQLVASDTAATAAVTRGPYLQLGTPASVVVRWRTDLATDSRVSYGTTQGSPSANADHPTLTTEHEVTLSGLAPATQYFYSIGTTTQALGGGDATHFFVTSPAVGSSGPFRVWVLGDSGTANASAAAVRDAYYTFTGAAHTNLWLMLGDNAYDNGTDGEYQAAVFNMYPTMLRKSVLWSTIGNHDTAGSSNPPAGLPYFAMFTLPAAAEAGGVASGTERYYSFDYGNVHFICLDSMTSDRSPGGPMATWLQNDLAATQQQWVVAFWHHPPYSKGSHNSDTETQLVQMRQNFLPILEAGGVDLVLAGHSHSYERSYLIDGHYGSSATFTDAFKKNGGSGRTDGTGSYLKPTLGPGPHEGAVYAVAGSSGQISGGLLNHPAMFISLNNLGSMVLDFSGDRLDAKFLRENGAAADYFTIVKGAVAPAPPAAPTALGAAAVSTARINLAWADNSSDEQGFRVERCAGANCTNFAQIAQLGAGVTSYANTGLTKNTLYRYRVRAFNAAGNSAYSNTAEARTLKK